MNDYKKYWIWLSELLGPAARTDEVLSAFPEPHKLFESSEKERMLAGVFTKAQIEKLRKKSLDSALNNIALCEKNGWHVVVPGDKYYPRWLRQIPDMPLVLYVDGDPGSLCSEIMLGIVGTRNPCYESVAITRRVSHDLCKGGATVISGGALGVDSAAHEGALDADGRTVCVLGCGLGTRYLISNAPMRRRITENGAVISEFAPFSDASRFTFPKRNRIISGMSLGVLVVEAGEKSGSLITAECARWQGRDVFAIPGSVLSSAYAGANRLIRDGARAVTSAGDILMCYQEAYPELIDFNAMGDTTLRAEEILTKGAKSQSVQKKECPQTLDPDSKAVYNLFKDEPLHPDDICAESGMPPSKVITALMTLEIEGLIEQTEGKNYILK